MQRALARYFIAYSVTAMLYVGIITFVYSFKTTELIEVDAPISQKVYEIEMALSTFVAAVETPKKMLKKVEEKVLQKSKFILKKKRIEKEGIKNKIVPKKIIIKKSSNPQRKVSTKTVEKQNKNQKLQASLAENKSFWTKVRRKIEKHKYYPRIAQKRGIEGVVKVRFRILSNGNVRDISVSGSKLFHNSAIEAVKRAFPISIKNMSIILPKSVTLPLHYRIR